ncbi:hypothetical protein BH11PSE11_BH11PSE11_10960 [soil metagenome]
MQVDRARKSSEMSVCEPPSRVLNDFNKGNHET